MDGDVMVLGAGMVGVSTALALRRGGLGVTLIDHDEPGRGTSYGNAGILSSGSVVPLNAASLRGSLRRYIGNTHPALRYRTSHVLANAGWMARFLAHAYERDPTKRQRALGGLIRSSLALHRTWAREAHVADRVRETGWLKVWRTAGPEAAEFERAALEANGIGAAVLDRQSISALEPEIAPIFRTGLFHSETASVDSPGAVTAAYAAMFAAEEGRIEKGHVRALEAIDGGWRVRLDEGTRDARHVVVALGPWSADLLAPLGYRVPLQPERGYHREYMVAGETRVRRPLYDAEKAFVITPVENGLRITSGVELAPRDAPSDFAQIDHAEKAARDIVPLGRQVGDTWRGARPTLPDSLPMIGRAPKHQGLWLAFGHQHIGLTTGPGTGALIAALLAGGVPPFDPAPFAPSRYL